MNDEPCSICGVEKGHFVCSQSPIIKLLAEKEAEIKGLERLIEKQMQGTRLTYRCNCGEAIDTSPLPMYEAKIEQQAERIQYLERQALADQKEASEQAEVIRIAREAVSLGKWLSEKALADCIDTVDLQEIHIRLTKALDKMNLEDKENEKKI